MWQAMAMRLGRLGRWLGAAALAAMLLMLLGACATSSTGNPSATATARALSCTPSAPATATPITTPGVQTTVTLPGKVYPFASVATHDGKWLVVSLDSGETGSIAVWRLAGHSATLAHVIPLQSSPAGLALTPDDRTLIVADSLGVAFVDAAKAEAGDAHALMGVEISAPAIEVALSQDGRYVFATDEDNAKLSVIDVRQAESDYYQPAALVGTVPLGSYPVGIALSPDGRYLYVANEGVQETSGPGTLSVVDVARAEQDPAHAVVGKAHAGCGDGRVVLSPDGSVAWVSARASNEVLAFDTAKLLSDPQHALIATTAVGLEPVGLALVNGGSELLVANSDRFAQPPTPQTVYAVDTQAALAGRPALKGSLTEGIFPRELSLVGQTAVLTNYGSGTISLIDTSKLP